MYVRVHAEACLAYMFMCAEACTGMPFYVLRHAITRLCVHVCVHMYVCVMYILCLCASIEHECAHSPSNKLSCLPVKCSSLSRLPGLLY